MVPNPNSKSSAILGRSFSLTQAGSVTIQRGKELGYALPLNKEYQSLEYLKRFKVTEYPLHVY